MLLSGTQRRFLGVTALVALGFVLGLAIQAPTVQQSVLGIDATRTTHIRSAALAPRPEAASCPDHGSADCAGPRDAGRGSLARAGVEPDQAEAPAAERPHPAGAADLHPEQRMITVYHGSKATQYVVTRER